MKQIQLTVQGSYITEANLGRIRQLRQNHPGCILLIQVFTVILDQQVIETVCAAIQKQLPDAIIVGCSSNGNIVDGDFSDDTFAVVCTLFEEPSSRVEVLSYSLRADTQREVTEKLREEVALRPWVKGIEMLLTIRGMSVTALCEGLSELPEDIRVFGGGAFCEDLEHNEACIFSSVGGYLEKGIVFILFGGEELHIETSFVTGWKPLGLYMDVTAADGALLKELNGGPAYDTYYKYLHIKNDENFFFNTLEFPFLYRYNGIDIMRAPTASNPDGSLTMTADISEGVKARIAYGDPWTILDSVWQQANGMLEFSPECIMVFSCAARRTFWGNAEVGKETEPYRQLAPTSGFYTSGEFLRTFGLVNQHNVTQVIAMMREGNGKPCPNRKLDMAEHSFEGKVSMINRMATFIKATTEELAEANIKLEEANRRLSEMSVTDALTRIGNKAAYFEKIKEIETRIASGSCEFSVAVFDLNGLKGINDLYGHECGDLAILDASKALSGVFGKENIYRAGGDEFIAILDHVSSEGMTRLFSKLEQVIADGNRTEKAYKTPLAVSKGYATYNPVKDTGYRDVLRGADQAMYKDKEVYYKTHDRRRKTIGHA